MNRTITMIPRTSFGLYLAAHLIFGCISAQADHYKVFILGGQSNMYGAGSKLESLPPELQKPQQDILFYSGSEFSKLKPGSGRSFGPEITFGRTIADALPQKNFYLIKHSDGGTSLWNEWNLKDGRSYIRLKNVVDLGLEALVKAGHTYEIVGMLWAQGERDAWNLRTTSQYEADFQAFIADMRSRYGEDLPFFFCRLSVKQTARPIDAVRTAQDYVAAADPNTYLIDTDAMEMQRDNLHYTGQGYIDMGRAFAQAYLNTLPGDVTDQTNKPAKAQTFTENGVIDGAQITVGTSDGSLSFSTFDQNGNTAWHPRRTVDGSGLSDGIHNNEKNTGWMTERIDPADTFIQWDLGASYRLQSVHVWNLKNTKGDDVGVRSADVYFSNVEFPGDPEGEGAANWIRWKDVALEFPAAPSADKDNTGFDLASATGMKLPGEPVRYIRFEVNGRPEGQKQHVGLAEIQFTGSLVDTEPTPSVYNTAKPADPSAPEITLMSPPRNATGVNPQRNLMIVFNKAVRFGTGAITLRTNDGKIAETFDVTNPSGNLRINGKTLTINPSRDLKNATTYILTIDDTAIMDEKGNHASGLGEKFDWSFTTVVPDVSAPQIVSLIPAAEKQDFFPADNLAITFNELIGFGTGAIQIRKSDGTLIESFDVANPPTGLSYLGNTVTINPSNDLPLGSKFYVEIEPTAIIDNAGNHYQGTQDTSTWSFATPETAQYATITFIDTQFDIESTKNDPTVGWRNTKPAKPLDIDGDHILGTDGWLMGTDGNTQSDPPYAKSKKTAPNGNAHGQWDNPEDPAGDDTNQGVLHDSNAESGETTAPLVTFTITKDLPEDTTLRLGLLLDANGGPNTATYTVAQTFGGTASATTPELQWTGESLDVAFFDLKHLRAGYTFTVTATTVSTENYPHAFEQLVGITFDTGENATNGGKTK